MAAAVLQTPANVPASGPYLMTSHQRINSCTPIPPPPAASSSRGQQPSASPSASPETSSKAFHRIRSSVEHSIRTATRSKKPLPTAADEFATITARSGKGNGKEKAPGEDPPREKEKSSMLKRLESKVTFRRARESVTPSPIPPVLGKGDEIHDKVRAAGFTSFITPSMRQGSMSSPSLHLSSQALPSPKSRSAIPALVSPPRDRTRQTSLQPTQREVSAPAPLGSRRINGNVPSGSGQPSREPTSRHRATKSTPPALPPSPSAPSLHHTHQDIARAPETPTRRNRDLPSPPETPTPASNSRGYLGRSPSRNTAASSTNLLLSGASSSPDPRAASPTRARSPTTRTRVVTPSSARGTFSTSASHLPLTTSTPSPPPRRPSIDSPRRPSVDSPHRPSGGTINGNRGESPSPRPRPVSPGQRSYAQNRHFNMSTASLSSPLNPEQRELVRTATSLLCKEMVKPPSHMSKSESGLKDWEEVEVRTRALARSERIWGKSGGTAAGSSINVSSSGTSSGLSSGGEERERRLFCDTLRDGFVLCQLINKLRSSSIVRPDAREDGFVRTSNITKFLAACSSYGLPDDDLFQRDDLIDATPESVARVARTIIALIKFVDTPSPERSKYLSGQAQKPGSPSTTSPYNPGTSSRAAASTPNLNIAQRHGSVSPPPPSPSPARKRWSPPSELPTVRSNSPAESANTPKENVTENGDAQTRWQDQTPDTATNSNERARKALPPIMIPPPKSPLRSRPSKHFDGDSLFTWAKNNASPPRASAAESTPASISGASAAESPNLRQSVASSAMTETTVTTVLSSIMDNTRYSNNRFGTIRTFTTDMTSEPPSISRAEGSVIADDLAGKRGGDLGAKHSRDRKMSEAPPAVDLTRVAEETDESVSSGGNKRDKGKGKVSSSEKAEAGDRAPAVHLHKGKWPDDFLDAFKAHSNPRPIATKSPTPDREDRPHTPHSAPISISPPRKLAVVGASRRNESLEALSQLPRRPTHRARQSIDAPVLMPKELILRRDVSPDGLPASGRVMLRRHSTKPGGPHRNGVHIPRNSFEDRSDGDSLVPFPRAASGERSTGSPSPRSSLASDPAAIADRPRIPRGRFQSDIEGSSSRRRPRPDSHDEIKPQRSRFESMVNLGAGSANASASDLLSRDSMDGSAVRRTLIVREDGKPPTHFQLGNCIGRGQFGSVYRALNLNTGQMVAVKRIRLEGLKEEEVTTLMREVDLVKSLSHPSIVKYEGMARDEDTLSIVLEYAENGSLGQTLKAFGKLNERLVASYVVKILEGLHYLHQSDVVHCDLKAANILTTKNGNVKLSDFGVSLNLRAMEREIKDVAGTPNWMAPEVIELKGASTKSDIWSLACTVIELLTGRPPYADVANSMSVMFRIVEDNMPPLPEGCSQPLQDFLTRCFNKDPTKRPSAEMLCEHHWLKKNWGAHKELRPQDSIPFLRRVSADLQKSEAVRYLSQIEMPDSPASEAFPRMDEYSNPSPIGRRMSNTSMRPLADNDISPREHSFVKTTFSKPMICRVCLLNVKKSAVLCAQCSLIAHAKCTVNAPPTCDLRAQLLLYAQYAEKGNPGSAYSNPLDALGEIHPSGPASDVAYVSHTPRTSIEIPPSAASPGHPAHSAHPPGAFKFMAAFKRSRSNLSPESAASTKSEATEDMPVPRKPKLPMSHGKERPQSLMSSSTDANTSSLRSAATAAESFSSRHDAPRKSRLSSNGTDRATHATGSAPPAAGGHEHIRPSKMTPAPGPSDTATEHDETHSSGIPGALPAEFRRHKKQAKSTSNCIVQ